MSSLTLSIQNLKALSVTLWDSGAKMRPLQLIIGVSLSAVTFCNDGSILLSGLSSVIVPHTW